MDVILWVNGGVMELPIISEDEFYARDDLRYTDSAEENEPSGDVPMAYDIYADSVGNLYAFPA